MQANRPSLGLITSAACTVALLAASSGATEKVLHNFGFIHDGIYPAAALVFDGEGKLYGTTLQGGSEGDGTVFETSPDGTGGWTTKVLHNFGIDGTDGRKPAAGLIFDSAGNLYGTTSEGGSQGDGTVFEMTPNGSGGWTERVIHNFDNVDGEQPAAPLILDGAGNLYGTTYYGGSMGVGTVFETSPDGSGGWTTKVLHNFGIGHFDGQVPAAGLTFDGAGNLYGTTTQGGTLGQGAVFEMTPNGSGGWTERVIHNFPTGLNDGLSPYAGLILDSSGNLYGTTSKGGAGTVGTVFQMSPDGSGGWTETVLYSFTGDGDGWNPFAGLVFDGSGNLYGTTSMGGSKGDGTVFEMTPDGSGGWTEFSLHNFGIGVHDAQQPRAPLILDGAGNLYGTTYYGGSVRQGTVFEVAP